VNDTAEITRASLLFGAVGVLYIGIGIPLLLGRVRPNSWYGSRTRKTLSDDRIWYAVNRVTGRAMMVTGIAVIAAAVVVFLIQGLITPNFAAAFPLVVLLVGVALMVINSVRAERRL